MTKLYLQWRAIVLELKMMRGLIHLQLMVICLSWFVAWWFFGGNVATSVLAGGLTYFIPTVLAVSVLARVRKTPEWLPIVLLLIEIHKVILIIMVMALIHVFYPMTHWVSYVVGLILVTQVGLLMFRKSSYYE